MNKLDITAFEELWYVGDKDINRILVIKMRTYLRTSDCNLLYK